MTENPTTDSELPKYRCHKEVWALKIKSVRRGENGFWLNFEDDRYLPRNVTSEYFVKHQPQVGGYWVRYEDGYESWSPAEPFEAGYTLIEK